MYARRSQVTDFATFFAKAKLVWAITQSACHKNLFSLMVHRPKNTQRVGKVAVPATLPFLSHRAVSTKGPPTMDYSRVPGGGSSRSDRPRDNT